MNRSLRLRGLIFALAVLVVVACSYFLGRYGTSPSSPNYHLPPLEPAEPVSPFEITVSLPQGPDDVGSLGKWVRDEKVNILFFVHYKNISNRKIVLPAFAYWHSNISFLCASWFSKPQIVFYTLTGQIKWLLVKPGETVTSFGDLSEYLIFKTSGDYRLKYTVSIAYNYYTGNNEYETEQNLERDYSGSSNLWRASASGSLNVPITAAQSSSGW